MCHEGIKRSAIDRLSGKLVMETHKSWYGQAGAGWGREGG